ncbi:hypothetical protein [Candidatus Venteria ishoeyi]|uniref:Uncharacterized protein n=1 Tax=Candidatus Venteria ishoeyi TaxID=1899563 RepID=A0A1H6F5H8_9GAMM|nr:hypothetical protein [Candidatus Venteria ishoeyi]SEH05427.1 Uncharacterised protein [Candidatus Venteria ishoeyi]
MIFGKYENNKLTVVDTLDSAEEMKARGYFTVPRGTIAGLQKDFYNKDFSLKTVSELVENNLLAIKATEKVLDNRIVDKSEHELMIDGLKDIPNNLKLVNGKIEPKTLNELYTDKVISKDEWLAPIRGQRNQLLNDVDLIYCNALNLSDMSDTMVDKWKEYKLALKDYPSIATVSSEFPSLPQGV